MNAPADTDQLLPLIHRIRQGERGAFGEIVVHYQRAVFAHLGRMGLGQAMAQDVAQESFLRTWTQLNRYDPARAQFSTWLLTIVHNLALNELGRAGHRLGVGAAGAGAAGDEVLPELGCDLPQPPDALAAAQRVRQVQAALRLLPAPDRSALALAHVQALDFKDVARIEGCSLAAIKVRLHRAKARLRQLLEKT